RGLPGWGGGAVGGRAGSVGWGLGGSGCGGWPLGRGGGGQPRQPAEPVLRARLARDVASATGRLDVVQVRLEEGLAVPLFGLSALLSVLTAADGFVVVPEEATGLGAGAHVDVTCYG